MYFHPYLGKWCKLICAYFSNGLVGWTQLNLNHPNQESAELSYPSWRVKFSARPHWRREWPQRNFRGLRNFSATGPVVTDLEGSRGVVSQVSLDDTSFDRYGMDDGCIVLFLVGFSQDRVDTPRRNKRSCIHRGFFYFTGHSWPFLVCSSRALSPVLSTFFWSGRLNSTFTVKKQDGHPVGQDVYNIVAIFCLEFPLSASAIQTSSNF